MSIPDPDKLWAKLDKVGVDEVRKKLAMGVFGKPKIALVNEWLRKNDTNGSASKKYQLEQDKDTPVDKLTKKIKNHQVLAPIIAISLLVLALLTFSTNFLEITQKLWKTISPTSPAQLELSIIDGGINEIRFHALNSGELPTAIKEVRVNSVLNRGAKDETHKTQLLEITPKNLTIDSKKSLIITGKVIGKRGMLPQLHSPDVGSISKDVGLTKSCSLDVIFTDFQFGYKTSTVFFYCIPM